ncbi:MAG TPA: hypothetical protein VHZ02_12845 [Acidimicrobiales bacterium]|nr:hypothetical protein [Acidimicrobiales bacterium]
MGAPGVLERPPGSDDRSDSVAGGDTAEDSSGALPDPAERRSGWRRARPIAFAFAAYLILGVALWWNAWAHPASTGTCACGDSALFLWFLEWPAYAIAHGHNLFYSTSLFHPQGVNLLSNTSELAFGVPLAPVTWLFGPVATLNVASTLSPVLSAFACFWLLRRWIRWSPAAFLGGLLYGFSPFVIIGLSDSHLMVSALFVPPLVIACLDELLVRQRRRPARVGLVLALLVVIQFFLSTEMLVLMAVMALVGLALLVAYAAVVHRDELRHRFRHAAVGLSWAGVVAVVLLAYPAWFALAGPAHLAGLVWPGLADGTDGSLLSPLVHASYYSSNVATTMNKFGGYQGKPLTGEYFGYPLFAVLLVGLAVWRRDLKLWFFAALGLASVALSLSTVETQHRWISWVPWEIVARLPVIQNVIQGRLIGFTYLFAAIMLALILARAHDAVLARSVPARHHAGGRGQRSWLGPAAAAGVALVIAAVALVPVARTNWGTTPLAMQPAYVPRWLTEVAPKLPPKQVILAYPTAFSGIQSSMAWQAIEGMPFAMAGGGGPEGIPSRAGKERPGFIVISAASLSFGPLPPATGQNVAAVRAALVGWGVTKVVVPNDPHLPAYEQGSNLSYALGLFSAALGQRPEYQAGAWVWSNVPAAPPPATVDQKAFDSCVSPVNLRTGSLLTIPDCVLGSEGSPAG